MKSVLRLISSVMLLCVLFGCTTMHRLEFRTINTLFDKLQSEFPSVKNSTMFFGGDTYSITVYLNTAEEEKVFRILGKIRNAVVKEDFVKEYLADWEERTDAERWENGYRGRILVDFIELGGLWKGITQKYVFYSGSGRYDPAKDPPEPDGTYFAKWSGTKVVNEEMYTEDTELNWVTVDKMLDQYATE